MTTDTMQQEIDRLKQRIEQLEDQQRVIRALCLNWYVPGLQRYASQNLQRELTHAQSLIQEYIFKSNPLT